VFAAALAATGAAAGRSTLLVDADPWGGGADLLVGAEEVTGLRWSDLAATTGRVAAASLRGVLPVVDDVAVLSWGRDEPVPVAAGAARTVLTAARRGHHLVVADLAHRGDAVAEALAMATLTVLVVPAQDARGPVMDMVMAEVTKDNPGQQVVLDRLLDLALITTLRAWFARPEAEAPGWYRAQSDPIVGSALRLLHDTPAYPWTVAALAAKAGASRAALARRFGELVGEPPMSYLANWRIALAADLLRDTDATVEAIARQVGYANSFALSVAFKRLRGVSPSRHRLAG